jgi:hypothetical protein
MANNYRRGFDCPAGTPTANTYFVSKSGDDLNAGNDPDNPKLTLSSAIGIGVAGITVVVGTGSYSETLPGVGDKTFVGDPLAVIDGQNKTFTIGAARTAFENFQLIETEYNIGTIPSPVNTVSLNCTFFSVDVNIGNTSSINGQYSVYVNTVFDPNINGATTGNNRFEYCIFDNCSFPDGVYEYSNCVFINGTPFNIDNGVSPASADYNFLETGTPIRVNGVMYADLAAQQAALPSINPNSIQADDPGFNDAAKYDYTITRNSVLFGNGTGFTNIGGAILGTSYTQGNTVMDTAVDANPNLAFNSNGELELQPGAGTEEQIIVEVPNLQQAPIGRITPLGYPDYVNNMPDSDNTQTNPNRLLYELDEATGLDSEGNPIYADNWKLYPFYKQPVQNDSGISSGDDAFLPCDARNLLTPVYFRLRLAIRSDYNPA